MDIVQFVTIEDDDALVLSFSFNEETRFGIDGFIIQRSPKFEFALRPYERAPAIDWTEDDEVIIIKEIHLSRKKITIKTQYELYSFDLTKVSEEEYHDVIKILKKMNFDNAFKFTFI